ncbi:MAG: S1 RNA-binding domain-containing protein [Dehalococcoidia bacterium]
MTNEYEETSSSQGSSGGGEMAALLEESSEFKSPQRGDIVEGIAMGWDRDGLLVDIGAKSEGVVPRNEMQSFAPDAESKIQPGAKILVFIVQPDAAEGQILLSLDRARGERGWHVLQERFESGETFEGPVTGHNKGGLLVNVEGVNAFVPLSQLVGVRPDRNREDGGVSSLAEAVGKQLRLKVIEINRRRNRVILSERAALQEWRMAQKERLIEELHEGDIRRGRISSVRNFGVFVDLGGADGLAHLSELSWERDKTPAELFNVGDEVDVYITKIDPENKKIALSLRRANPSKWEAVVSKFREGQVVTGLVTKLVTFGAFARIEGPVEGLIHVSELVDRRIGHPKEVTREGDLLPLKIVRIERDRHRLGLSLRRARDEGEAMGYVFSEGGEVISVPDSIRQEFEAREGPIPPPSDRTDEDETTDIAMPASEAGEDSLAGERPVFDTSPAEAAVGEEPMAAQDSTSEATAEASPASEDSVEPEAQASEAEPQATEAEVEPEQQATEAEPIVATEEQDDNVTTEATVADDAHEAQNSMDSQVEQEAPAPDETSAVEEEEETNTPS